jgi:hypothetical protein
MPKQVMPLRDRFERRSILGGEPWGRLRTRVAMPLGMIEKSGESYFYSQDCPEWH